MTLLAILFPSPFEVDRYLYDGNADFEYFPSMFPAPLEVDRELYIVFYNYTYELDILFPAPTEVDRFFYLRFRKEY